MQKNRWTRKRRFSRLATGEFKCPRCGAKYAIILKGATVPI